jgi:hypothetical protein
LPDPLRHVRALAEEIGPRGATTAAEARAARYIAEAARGYTHQVWLESFSSFPSSTLPWLLILGLCAAGGATLWLSPQLGAALGTVGAVCYAGQALGWIQVGWLFPRRESQNVVTVVPAREAIRRRIVLVAHYDTGKRVGQWLRPGELRSVLLTVTAAAMALPALAVLYATSGEAGWMRLSLLPLLAVGGSLAVLALWHRRAPFSLGAAESAAGVGVALSAGSAIARAGLCHTEVWVVFTGCREPGMVGLQALLQRHGAMLADADFVVLDRFGTGPLAYAYEEGLLDPQLADRRLVALLGGLGAAHPEWGLAAVALGRPRTQASLALEMGLSAVAILTAGDSGESSAQVRPKGLYEAVHLVRELARRIDLEAREEAMREAN